MIDNDAVFNNTTWILKKAIRLLRENPLCDNCLGRMFALLGRGWSNRERGDAIKRLIIMSIHRMIRESQEEGEKLLKEFAPNIGEQAKELYRIVFGQEINPKPCAICGSRLDSVIVELSRRAVEELRKCKVNTFLVAAHIDDDIKRLEEHFRIEYGLQYAESIGSELKREVSKVIQMQLGLKPDFNYPDVVIEIWFPLSHVSLRFQPLLLEGKYWKISRRVSQSIWITRRGVKRYSFSVEEALLPLLELYDGTQLILHAAGREDVDVRMLGTGRPMVVEIKEAKRRDVDVKEAIDHINRWAKGLVNIELIGRSNRERVREIKGEKARHVKTYRALIVAIGDVNRDKLQKLEEYFNNITVRQRTPRRVRHRRPDIVRERRVYSVKVRPVSSRVFEALIRCEGGLYVKELVDGDGGDTSPSFAEVVGEELYCAELDVVAVEEITVGKGRPNEGF